jgi:hypothetical protein
LSDPLCPAAIVMGREPEDRVNAAAPVPVIDAAFTVTAEPEALSTTVCVAVSLSTTLPYEMLLAFALKVPPALSWRAKFAEAPFSLPAIVATCDEVTAETVAVNEALVAPDATVTELGRVTAESLLDKFTRRPFVGAAPFKVAVHASDPDALIDEFVHEIEVRAAMPDALISTTRFPLEEFEPIVRTPVNELT